MDAPSFASESLGPDQLKFFGKDSNECENFIADVMKRAYDQGKQRDDEWIADFVESCLRQDALHWWTELDEATQGSWKLLRKALLLRFGPLFSGESGEEAEKFVFWIRQRARNAGKLEDPQWIATFASPFFAGRALRWYSSLQMNVQKDWNALQRAIFMQYPREGEDGEESSIFPTPPSAIVTSPPFKARRRGYVKVIRDHDPQSYYLSKTRHSDGFLLVGTSLANALEVEYREDNRNETHTLYIPDNQVANYDVLGITWENGNPDTSTWAATCPIDSSLWRGSWNRREEGLLVTSAWKITSEPKGDVTISAMNGSACLYALASGTSASIDFYKNKPASDAARIVFEPI